MQKKSSICVLLIESREGGSRKKGPETIAINVSNAHISATPAIVFMLEFSDFFCTVVLLLVQFEVVNLGKI